MRYSDYVKALEDIKTMNKHAKTLKVGRVSKEVKKAYDEMQGDAQIAF